MIKDLIKALSIAEFEAQPALNRYSGFLNNLVEFSNFSGFSLAPDKGYTAKATAIAKSPYSKEPLNTTLVAFASGDATGNADSFNLQDVIIPYWFGEKDKKLLPRKKEDIHLEAILPLFSVYDEKVFDNVIFLEMLGKVNSNPLPRIMPISTLGINNPDKYNGILYGVEHFRPQNKIQLTAGYDHEHKRFGDPHTIYYPPGIISQDALQVVAFLSVKDKNSDFSKLFQNRAEIPESIEKLPERVKRPSSFYYI